VLAEKSIESARVILYWSECHKKHEAVFSPFVLTVKKFKMPAWTFYFATQSRLRSTASSWK